MRKYLLALLITSSFAVYGAETMYVQSAKAKLLENPTFTAKSIKELEKGDAVTVTKKQDRWIQVKQGSSSGWISSLLLSSNKPIDKISVLGDDSSVSDNARRRASAVITAGATRGLSADDRQRVGDSNTSNFAALRWVESISVSREQMAVFDKGDVK